MLLMERLFVSCLQVVLSQMGGSNRGGFKIVQSSMRNIYLDGVFNIVSYDIVPKLQNILLQNEYKVSCS